MAHYFATVLPGLEYVLRNEIRVKIADAKFQSLERGKVYFTSKLPIEALMALRTADNLYRLIHRFQVGPHKIHLANIEQEIYTCDLSWAYSNRSGMISYKVNASRMGKHTYSRFDAAEAAARGIARRDSRCWHDIVGKHEMEFRLDINHDEAVFALRLTDASFRYRNAERKFSQAALRPTVAHALVWLSNPEETDVFVDPCCGSGTILAERLVYPYFQIDGGDLSKDAVEVSKENTGSHNHARIHHWDARQLPLDSDYIDKIVTNLPFGRQIAADENISGLYCDVLKEMKRVLKRNGSVLCLTDADAALQIAAERVQFSCSKETTLSLKGLHPTVFSLKKQ
ncbi:methyltransferase domain-containing protein [Cohnella silvisoli]|uniref:Methyltransferase domain-containing protein n=1 Tax=Cohnella silvisoli TaxID=2873699 RepID=A0ABV1KLD7_9BACL|nr:methyltransferase domain-containing protein [Cohnella silvisoli]MCD9020734.1 RNA methyltransferase [Cohnella silvisoli]